jgi:8-oxo-dGTP pyrophosphatase MutT (NUDIX family)
MVAVADPGVLTKSMTKVMSNQFIGLLRQTLAVSVRQRERHESRRQFSPSMAYGRHFVPPLAGAKKAAVMILLKPTADGWSIPLTERPAHLPDHPGQISLPGGRLEYEEEPVCAAIREFNEELGTASFPGEVVGSLQPIYVFNSDYYVTPFVAVANASFDYSPCQHEVARVIEMPIDQLLGRELYEERQHRRGFAVWKARQITCEGARVWGATAIILGEFAQILRETMPETR